jgi:hypothetical protein
MEKIKLTNCDEYALVDDADYSLYGKLKWYKNSRGYVCRVERPGGEKKYLKLHRLVNQTPSGLFTDHINHNKLDNRKVNLRSVTQWGNSQNNAKNTSGCVGVSFDKKSGKWRAKIATKISANETVNYVCCFDDKTEAITARKSWEKEIQNIMSGEKERG